MSDDSCNLAVACLVTVTADIPPIIVSVREEHGWQNLKAALVSLSLNNTVWLLLRNFAHSCCIDYYFVDLTYLGDCMADVISERVTLPVIWGPRRLLAQVFVALELLVGLRCSLIDHGEGTRLDWV